MRTEDEAYLAGLFDGEGYVGVQYVKAYKNGKRYKRLSVHVTQQRREVLDWIQEQLGYGTIHKGSVSSGGQIWRYHVSYRQAEKFLKTVLPYLKVKLEEASEALSTAYPSQ